MKDFIYGVITASIVNVICLAVKSLFDSEERKRRDYTNEISYMLTTLLRISWMFDNPLFCQHNQYGRLDDYIIDKFDSASDDLQDIAKRFEVLLYFYPVIRIRVIPKADLRIIIKDLSALSNQINIRDLSDEMINLHCERIENYVSEIQEILKRNGIDISLK